MGLSGAESALLIVKILHFLYYLEKTTSQNYFHGLELEVDGEKEMMFIEKESIQFQFLPPRPVTDENTHKSWWWCTATTTQLIRRQQQHRHLLLD